MSVLRAAVMVAGVAVCAAAEPHVTPKRLRQLYSTPSPFEAVPRAKWVAQSENAYVIRDINPQAPVHLLVIPKKRVPSLLQAPPELVGEMFELAKRVARQEGIADDGFRTIINTHPFGRQTVYHFPSVFG